MFATVGTVTPGYLMDPVRAGYIEEHPQGYLAGTAKRPASGYQTQEESQGPVTPEQIPSCSLDENHARNQDSSQGMESYLGATLHEELAEPQQPISLLATTPPIVLARRCG